MEETIQTLRIALPEIGQDVRNYVNWIRASGMDPIIISMQHSTLLNPVHQEFRDYKDFNIDYYDGLILPGGRDINPSRYGETVNGAEDFCDELDEMQLAMLDAFVQKKKPVFGICRGMQLINVYFGGSLIQNIDTVWRHRAEDPEGPDAVHLSEARSGSWLEGFYGREFPHNSAHHQAVKKLGDGLTIDSRCPMDSVVEAIHHENLPVYGVQWHPERMCLENCREDTVEGLPVMFFFAGLCIKNRENEGYEVKLPDLSGIMGL